MRAGASAPTRREGGGPDDGGLVPLGAMASEALGIDAEIERFVNRRRWAVPLIPQKPV